MSHSFYHITESSELKLKKKVSKTYPFGHASEYIHIGTVLRPRRHEILSPTCVREENS